MNVPVYTRDGQASGRTVALDPTVFGITPNDHVLWLDVRAIQTNQRQGTVKTKERGEVAFSTRKLFKQKGTGGARRGSRKSPLLKGGGTVFGPQPKNYQVRLNQKTKQLARRSALSRKVQEGGLRVVEDFTFETPQTKGMAALLQAHQVAGQKVLLLTNGTDRTLYLSGRNLPKLQVQTALTANTVDLLGAQTILLLESALQTLTQTLSTGAEAEG